MRCAGIRAGIGRASDGGGGSAPGGGLGHQGRVALGPGPTFGGTSRVGDGRARLTYATPPDVLREIVTRLASALP